MSTTITPPNLGSIITSHKARTAIYGVYVLALLAAGAIQVAFGSIHVDTPQWFVATLAVLLYLGIPVGSLALANVTAPAASAALAPVFRDPTAPATVAPIVVPAPSEAAPVETPVSA